MRHAAGGFLAALAVLAACAGEPVAERQGMALDLVADHDLAEVHAEVGLIDLGAPGARPHLLSGWSWDETAGDGATFVWSEGDESVLAFFSTRPRRLGVAFRAFPFAYEGAPEQAVEVWLNGRRVGETALAPGPAEYAVALPEEGFVSGENRLAFRYRWSRSPAEVGAGGDRRRLAVGWDWVRLGGGPGPAPPESDPAAGTLTLTFGTQVDHFLDLPAGSALTVAAVERRGAPRNARREDGRGWVEAVVAREGRAEEEVGRLEPTTRPRTLELPAPEPGLARLSLRAVGETGASSLVLSRPAVVGPVALVVPEEAPGAASAPEEAPAAGDSRPAPRPPVLLYLVDTLRADRLGCYGYDRPTSPRLDAFAAGATLFEHAFAQTSWTKPAVASILTGLPPRRHGVNHPEAGLPEGVALLAEVLAARGYATAGFTANAHVSPASGFARGFDRFEFLIEEPNDAAAVNRRVFDWLGGLDTGRPFFLFVHTIDPHAPYAPPERFRRRLAAEVADPRVGSVDSIRAMARGEVAVTDRRLADLSALYDAEVAANDAALGELLDELDRRGLLDAALVVFLSDHGEEFHEHGVLGHGWDLYGEVLRVPLVVRLPGQREGRRRVEPVQQVDLLPTILAHLGLPVPGELPGADLLRLAGGDAAPARPGPASPGRAPSGRRPLYAYMDYEGREGASVVLGEWHLIEPLAGRFAPGAELYQRLEDPAESRDVAAELPVLAGYLRRLVRAHLRATAGAAAPTAVDLDPETRRRLEALGYL